VYVLSRTASSEKPSVKLPVGKRALIKMCL
jgi:hypothetical protein